MYILRKPQIYLRRVIQATYKLFTITHKEKHINCIPLSYLIKIDKVKRDNRKVIIIIIIIIIIMLVWRNLP